MSLFELPRFTCIVIVVEYNISIAFSYPKHFNLRLFCCGSMPSDPCSIEMLRKLCVLYMVGYTPRGGQMGQIAYFRGAQGAPKESLIATLFTHATRTYIFPYGLD